MNNIRAIIGFLVCVCIFTLGMYLIRQERNDMNAKQMIIFRLKHHEMLIGDMLDIEKEISDRLEEIGQRLSKLEEKRIINVRAK